MRKLLLLLPMLALCARGSVVEIWSGTASSGAGVSGIGDYSANVQISFTLEQYELVDMPSLPNLWQPIYFRYSYLFSAPGGFRQLILGVSDTCAADTQCIFGITTDGTPGAIGTYSNEPGLENAPLRGIKIDGFDSNANTISVSFFSNRAPGPESRVHMRKNGEYFVTDPGAVPTPDFPVLPVEEPAQAPEAFSMALAGGGLFALAVFRQFRR